MMPLLYGIFIVAVLIVLVFLAVRAVSLFLWVAGVLALLFILNRSQGEMRIWEEVKQWSTSVSQVQVEELQRVT